MTHDEITSITHSELSRSNICPFVPGDILSIDPRSFKGTVDQFNTTSNMTPTSLVRVVSLDNDGLFLNVEVVGNERNEASVFWTRFQKSRVYAPITLEDNLFE